MVNLSNNFIFFSVILLVSAFLIKYRMRPYSTIATIMGTMFPIIQISIILNPRDFGASVPLYTVIVISNIVTNIPILPGT